jgi:hypothetical protein
MSHFSMHTLPQPVQDNFSAAAERAKISASRAWAAVTRWGYKATDVDGASILQKLIKEGFGDEDRFHDFARHLTAA